MQFLFDGINRLIYVQSPVVNFDVKFLYSDWKRWSALDTNLMFPQAMKSIGGEPITDTISISPYIEVMNGWRIKPYDGDYELSVYGNIFATGGINPFIAADNGNVLVTLEVTSNSLAVTGESDEIQLKLDTIISRLNLTAQEKSHKAFV